MFSPTKSVKSSIQLQHLTEIFADYFWI